MPIIGIDLGTSNSAIAYWTNGRAQLIPNALGQLLTPSIVGVDDNGEILVGEIAKERLVTHLDLTVAVFKRHMGTEKLYKLNQLELSSIELSMFIIKSLIADAEAFLEESVTEAVISVPAYFNDTQRNATKHAAELAGLKVERLISEPTAAALSYGLHETFEEANFLVFDLGGGTYDVSILEFFNGVMEVRSIAGDNYLGGEDFTNLLIDYFLKEQKLDLNELGRKNLAQLKKQAELAKHQLGTSNKATLQLNVEGKLLTETITKQVFEKLAEPLIIRLRNPIERAMRDASVTPADLDAVVLIGGATRMPIVKSIISRMMGRLPFSDINPDETVALGAAVQAALKNRNADLDELILTDVCPYTLGIGIAKVIDGEIRGSVYSPIIERNSPIPISRVEEYNTIYDQQEKINIRVFQGESRSIENNLALGELEIAVPMAPAGHEVVDVRFTYDVNGILEVECRSHTTNEKVRTIIENNPNQMTKEEVEVQLDKLSALKIHPRERSANRILLARGERLYEELLGEKRETISEWLSQFEAILQTQDEVKINHAAIRFKEALDYIERWQSEE